MVLMATSMALSLACRMFWQPSSYFGIWVLLLGSYSPDHVVLPFYLAFKDFGWGNKGFVCVCG
jgi:hypothetical protein